MFDPSIGRWVEEDPMGFEAGDTNLYRYVGNNPLDRTDPNGLGPFEPLATALIYQDIFPNLNGSIVPDPGGTLPNGRPNGLAVGPSNNLVAEDANTDDGDNSVGPGSGKLGGVGAGNAGNAKPSGATGGPSPGGAERARPQWQPGQRSEYR